MPVDKIDWELCGDIEEWVSYAFLYIMIFSDAFTPDQAKKMRNERENTEHNEVQDGRLKRKRLPTPDSEVEGEGEDEVVTRPTRKKPKTLAYERVTCPASDFLSYDTPEAPIMDVTTIGSFATMSIEAFEEGFPAGGARLSRSQRRDRERQNFAIWSDEIVEGSDDDSASDKHGCSETSWDPAEPGDAKENEPPEFDIAVDDEFDNEYDEYYYAVEEVHQQQVRAVLSEIQIQN
jgi:hypothetical protein